MLSHELLTEIQNLSRADKLRAVQFLVRELAIEEDAPPAPGVQYLTREAFFSTSMSEEKVQKYFSRIQDDSYLGFLDMVALNPPPPKRFKTPLLVLRAANDTLFHSYEIAATARAYNTQAVIFPDMAHDMMLEANLQAVADRIIGWLIEQGE